MILAIPEYDAHPTDPAQWDRYYNLSDDKIYIQTLPVTDPSYPTWVEMARGAAVRESMRISDTLVRSKYAARDYQTFLDEIVAQIAEKWGSSFNDFMSSDPAIMLAEYVSGALDQMSWNLDREVDEWYISLARLRDSAVTEARGLGYRVSPAVAATLDVQVTLPSGPYPFDVTLREGHQFQGPNGLIFTLDSDQTIPAGDTTKLCTVYQGQKFLETFTSNGQPNQIFKMSLVPKDDFVAQGYVELTVAGSDWPEFDFLPYEDTEAFEVHYLNSPPKIKFGDGLIGKIPPINNEIRISYISTSGKKGRLATSGTVNKSLTPVVVNFQTIPISCTNPEGAVSGDDAETLASIKANAPLFFDTADRCVTKGDIETLAGHFNDPLYGAIAKANALSIRGVEEDLQLKALLDAILSDKDDMTTALEDIRTKQESIKAATGSISVAGTIRALCSDIGVLGQAIRDLVNDTIADDVDETNADITIAQEKIDEVSTQLDFVPFQELVGKGDGTTVLFSGLLAKKPIKEGTFAIFVSDKTPEHSGSDGDCDTAPGEFRSASAPFVASDVGKLIRMGGEYRQIQKYKSATAIEYSGPRIYGTSLIWDVYPPAIVGYDDGGGNITGTGIAGGSISYVNGAWSVTFSVAPTGISGQYGVPIVATYSYKNEGLQATLVEATTACDDAKTAVASVTTDGGSIITKVDDIDTNLASVVTKCDAIDTDAEASIADVDTILYIPVQIGNDIDAVYAYLDEIISGECKANIIRISCLVYDSNGFYTAPSLSLLTALSTYMADRRIETVRYSIVSGDYWLLEVSLTVQIKITDQYVFTEVASRVQSALDTMFKGRAYKQPLLRQEYYKAVGDNEGVDYSNITISGEEWANSANTDPVPSIDTDGNLFIDEHVVITKGTITIVQIY